MVAERVDRGVPVPVAEQRCQPHQLDGCLGALGFFEEPVAGDESKRVRVQPLDRVGKEDAVVHRAADGCSSGTAPSHPVRRTCTSEGGVSRTAAPDGHSARAV